MDAYTIAAIALCALLVVCLAALVLVWSGEEKAPEPQKPLKPPAPPRPENATGWSFAVTYTARDDDGKPFPARSVFYTETNDLADAIEEARVAAGMIGGGKIGAFLPGQHARVP